MGDEKLHTIDDVAKRFYVTPVTVRTWIKSGKIKAIKIGQRWLITDKAIAELVEAGEREAEREIAESSHVAKEQG